MDNVNAGAGFEQTLKTFKNNFAVIAHRGARAYCPENTMPAFRKAIELGADMLEFDVQLTRDKIPVVFHDAVLDKLTDGTGKVADYTFEQLRRLDAGGHLSKEFKGEKIPALLQVLELAAGQIPVNIEIKTEAVESGLHALSVENQVVDMVRKMGIAHEVMISSFDYRAISRVKKLAPELYTAVLYDKKQAGSLNAAELVHKFSVNAFNCSKRELNKARLEVLHQNRIPFFIYTVNTVPQMRKVLKAGARGIFTDKPDVLRNAADLYFEEL